MNLFESFMKKIIIIFLICVFLFCSCESEKIKSSENRSEQKNNIINGKTLTIGSVAINYKYEEETYRPVIQYIVEKLNSFGYTQVGSVIVGSLDELIKKANNDEVDIFFGSLYPTVTVDRKSKLEPVLKADQNGIGHYYSVFFTNSKSGINSLDSINGKMIAFENRYSTSGYFYPKTVLKKMGYRLNEFENPGSVVDKNEIGYSFSSDDQNTAFWVLNGHVDIGVTDNEVFEYFSENLAKELKLIHKSKKLLRFITSIRSNLPEEVKKSLINLFLEMPNDPEGKNILANFLGITKFEILDANYYSIVKKDFENYLLD